MRKFIIYLIPLLTISFFIMVMHSDKFLKYPINNEESIPDIIKKIENNINKDEWINAENNLKNLDRTWEKVSYRIQFAAEIDEINQLGINISRIRGAIKEENSFDAMIELSEANELWNNIGK